MPRATIPKESDARSSRRNGPNKLGLTAVFCSGRSCAQAPDRNAPKRRRPDTATQQGASKKNKKAALNSPGSEDITRQNISHFDGILQKLHNNLRVMFAAGPFSERWCTCPFVAVARPRKHSSGRTSPLARRAEGPAPWTRAQHTRTHYHTPGRHWARNSGVRDAACRSRVGRRLRSGDIHRFLPARPSALTHRHWGGVAALSVDVSAAVSVFSELIHLERI